MSFRNSLAAKILMGAVCVGVLTALSALFTAPADEPALAGEPAATFAHR